MKSNYTKPERKITKSKNLKREKLTSLNQIGGVWVQLDLAMALSSLLIRFDACGQAPSDSDILI